MMGTEQNNRPDVFWQANIDEAAAELVTVILEIKPQVLVTYDDFGGYGHPDHIQAHRVAMRAAELAKPHWEISKIYWNTMPRSVMQRGIDKMKEIGSDFMGADSAGDLSFVKDDEVATTVVKAPAFAHNKIEALKQHPTQMSLDGPFFALSNNLGIEIMGDEYYTLVKGEKAAPFDEDGRETDLFNGLA
jgi:N-acetyl-1-D-myo-inositol-2-amino-2-deoxy-alpha-D-glucopyranoside deacetylase